MSVLVIGADGLVGAAIARALRERGEVVHGTSRRPEQADKHVFLDLASPSIETAPLPRAETAILCAAVNGFARCRADPEGAYRVNVRATEILARRLSAQGSRVLFLSSSAVFDFRRPHVPSGSRPCPTTIYGANKALAEDIVRAAGTSNIVIRLTKVLAPNASLFATWLSALRSNAAVRAYSDHNFCPIGLNYAVRAVIAIMDRGKGGIYQVSGADDVSYADAARHLAKRMGRDESCVVGERAILHGIPPEEVARYTSLDSSGFYELTGETSPSPFGVLDRVFDPLIGQLLRA